MKKGTSTLFLLMAVLLSTAQKTSEQGQLTTLTKLDLGLMGVGFTVEPRLGNHMTMDLSVGAGGGYEVYSSNFHHTWNLFDPSFYFSVTPKLYYNRARPIGGDTDAFNTALMNIHWGMQRPAGTRWIFNTHFGVGYATDLEGFGGTLYPSLDLKFSYIFSKQR
jgi:hypothetical protein